MDNLHTLRLRCASSRVFSSIICAYIVVSVNVARANQGERTLLLYLFEQEITRPPHPDFEHLYSTNLFSLLSRSDLWTRRKRNHPHPHPLRSKLHVFKLVLYSNTRRRRRNSNSSSVSRQLMLSPRLNRYHRGLPLNQQRNL